MVVGIPEDIWLRGGTPDRSRIVPWAVQSLGAEDIAVWQGRLSEEIVDRAVAVLLDELQQ